MPNPTLTVQCRWQQSIYHCFVYTIYRGGKKFVLSQLVYEEKKVLPTTYDQVITISMDIIFKSIGLSVDRLFGSVVGMLEWKRLSATKDNKEKLVAG